MSKKYFEYCFSPILELDLDKIKKNKPNQNITLYECLKYYYNNNDTTICINCKNKVTLYKAILNKPKVLIIYLKRNNQKGVNDIKIDINLNITKFRLENKQENKVTKMTLKSYIGFKTGNKNEYFTDYCIKKKKIISLGIDMIIIIIRFKKMNYLPMNHFYYFLRLMRKIKPILTLEI